MTTMIPDLVVGEVNFAAPSAEADFYRAHNAALEAENRELNRSIKRLVRVLKRCVKPSAEIAAEASDAIEQAMEART